MSDIDKTLAERGARYGEFKEHAVIAQALQDVMRAPAGWARLAPDQKQALTVIADKIARMLNGDPNYGDNWHDIIGYAKLVEQRLAREQPQERGPYADVAQRATDNLAEKLLATTPDSPDARESLYAGIRHAVRGTFARAPVTERRDDVIVRAIIAGLLVSMAR